MTDNTWKIIELEPQRRYRVTGPRLAAAVEPTSVAVDGSEDTAVRVRNALMRSANEPPGRNVAIVAVNGDFLGLPNVTGIEDEGATLWAHTADGWSHWINRNATLGIFSDDIVTLSEEDDDDWEDYEEDEEGEG